MGTKWYFVSLGRKKVFRKQSLMSVRSSKFATVFSSSKYFGRPYRCERGNMDERHGKGEYGTVMTNFTSEMRVGMWGIPGRVSIIRLFSAIRFSNESITMSNIAPDDVLKEGGTFADESKIAFVEIVFDGVRTPIMRFTNKGSHYIDYTIVGLPSG